MSMTRVMVGMAVTSHQHHTSEAEGFWGILLFCDNIKQFWLIHKEIAAPNSSFPKVVPSFRDIFMCCQNTEAVFVRSKGMKPWLKQLWESRWRCAYVLCVCIFIDLTKSPCNNVRAYDCLCIHPSTTFNTPMQILSNSLNTPSSLKGKKVPPPQFTPETNSTPKSRRCGRLFFRSRWRVFKKKSCGHNFPRSDLTRTRGWCLNHLVPQLVGVLWRKDEVGIFICKNKLNLHKDGRSDNLKMWCLSISKKTGGPSLLKFWVASYMQPSLVKLYHLNSCFHFTPPKGQSHWCSRWRSSLGQTSPRNQQRWTESNKKSSCSQFQPHETLPGSVFEKIHFWVQWVRFW